MYKTTAWI